MSVIVITWIQLLYTKTSVLREMFPSRELITENVPPCFKSLTNVRVILDCFKIFAEHPRHFSEQENMYSSYKQHSTKFKVVLLEQQLLKQMARVELRGKRGCKVAVLLTKDHKHQMDNLNKTSNGNIDPANVYQFPRSGACKTPIRSCSASMPLQLHMPSFSHVQHNKSSNIAILCDHCECS